jgi:hypothetical protein
MSATISCSPCGSSLCLHMLVHTDTYKLENLITNFDVNKLQCVEKAEFKAFWEGRDMSVRKFQAGDVISGNVRSACVSCCLVSWRVVSHFTSACIYTNFV